MKVLVAILSMLGLISCEKDEKPPYTFSVEVNGRRWEGAASIVTSLADSIVIYGTIPQTETTGIIWMRINFQGTGEYLLPLNGGYSSTIGNDFTSAYSFDQNATGTMVINEFNPENNFLKGTFEMDLKKDFANPDTVADILSFRNGKFEGKIWSH